MEKKRPFPFLTIIVLLGTIAYLIWAVPLVLTIQEQYEKISFDNQTKTNLQTIKETLNKFENELQEYQSINEKDALVIRWDRIISEFRDNFKPLQKENVSTAYIRYNIDKINKHVNVLDSLYTSLLNTRSFYQRRELDSKVNSAMNSVIAEVTRAEQIIDKRLETAKLEVPEEMQLIKIEIPSDLEFIRILLILTGGLLILLTIALGVGNSHKRNAATTNVSLIEIFDQNQLIEYIFDVNGNILSVSSLAANQLGYNPQQLIGKTYRDITYKRDAELFSEKIKSCVAEKQSVHRWEIRRLDSKGRLHWTREYGRAMQEANGSFVILVDSEDVTESKESEIRLKLSDDILSKIGAVIVVTNTRGEVVYINPAVYEVFGYYPEELAGTGWWSKSLYADSDSSREKEKAALKAEGKKPIIDQPFERLMQKKNGDTCNVLWQESPGPKGLLISVGHDITDTKEKEKALEESASEYDSLFNSFISPIFVHDANGKIVQINEAAITRFGYSESDYYSMRIIDMVSPESEDEMNTYIERFNTEELLSIETELIRKDGQVIQSALNTSRVVYRGKTALLTMITDVSGQKLAESQLRMLSYAIEQSPASVLITNTEGNIIYVNPRFSEITGYSLEEIYGKNPRILKSGRTPKEYYAKLWSEISNGEAWYGEFLNKKKNGELFWELASISPIHDSSGKITNYISVKEDITERKKFEEDLKSARDKAEESNRLKTMFLNNMSHELRTPLIGILGYAEVLEDEIEDGELKTIAKNINEGGKRLTDTLNLVMDLSRLDANELELSLEEINIPETVKNLVEFYKPFAAAKNLDFDVNIKEPNLKANLDRRLFEDSIKNLIDNAIKFTKEGKVTVNVEFELGGDGMVAVIKIIDTGIGIDKENQKKIFEPFRQASEGNTREYEGAGLGLTVSKRFIEYMSGRIGLSSKPGKGTNIIVRFNAL